MAKATDKSLNELTKVVQSSNSKILKAQKETTRQLMSDEERAAADETNQNRVEGGRKAWETRQAKQLDESKEATNESVGFLGKIANFMGMDRLRGAAEAEKSEKAAKAAKKGEEGDKKSRTLLGKLVDGTKDKGKKAGGNIMKMLKNLAFGAFAVAILAFLQSPYFDKTVKVIKETIIPALTTLIDDYLIPIGKLFWDGILKSIDIFKDLMTDLEESFRLFGEGDWLGGTIEFFKQIGIFLGEAIDGLITLLYNTIAKIFGFEETDSVGGQIAKFFTDIYNNVKSFFTDTYDKVKNLIGDFAVFQFVEETLGDLFSSIKGIFSGDFSLENFTKLFGSIFDIVYYPINLAVNTIKDIFNLGDPDEPFRLSKFIGDAISKVINFFKGLLDFDMKSLIMKIPGAETVMGALDSVGDFFSGGDGKQSNTENRERMQRNRRGKRSGKSGGPGGYGHGKEYLDFEPDEPSTWPEKRLLGREEFMAISRAHDGEDYNEYRDLHRKIFGMSQQGGRGSDAGGRYEMKMSSRRFREPADPDMVGTLPRSNGNAGRGMTPPSGQQKQAPPIVNAPTTVKGGDSKTVMQMSKTLAPRDRAIDEIGLSI